MGLYLNPSNRLFQKMLNSDFYVDKTDIASFMNSRVDRDGCFVCMSRPRRFGKSVEADMLVAYYTKGADRRHQFEGLAASNDPSFREHLNAHDVIKIDMSQMMPLVREGNDLPSVVVRELLPEIRDAWPEAVPQSCDSLPKALAMAEAAKGSGFVFVIDEWDSIMRERSQDHDAQRAYLDFLRDLLKGRSYVDACYMTGILPIKKYGKHSALNIFTEYTVVDPKVIPHLFGSNADEVERLCERFDMDYDEMARWYDGYLLGDERIHV